MRSSNIKKSLSALALLVCVATGCKRFESLTHPTVMSSPDGRFQLTVPAGWQERPSLNEVATIRAANLLQEAYVIVISESKTDFADDMTLDKYTEITRTSREKRVVDGVSTPPLPVTINGNEGRQYAFEAVVNNVKISYLITAVETGYHYHQIITWTLRSRIDQNQAALLKVTNSFRANDTPDTDSSPSSHGRETP